MKTPFRNTALLLAALIASPAFAQYGAGGPRESDQDFCASGRSGLDFRSCMHQLHEAREQARMQMQMQAQQAAQASYDNGYYQQQPVAPAPGWMPPQPVVTAPVWAPPAPEVPAPGWVQPAPVVSAPGWAQPEAVLSAPAQPRLSDMQQRALDNCVLLQPSQQARCRATVWSTVR